MNLAKIKSIFLSVAGVFLLAFTSLPVGAQSSNPVEMELAAVKTELGKKTTESYIKARMMLENMVAGKKTNSNVYAYLSEVYCHLYYKNLEYAGNAEMLNKAEEMAVLSYNLNKNNYLAFRSLGVVLMLKGNYEKANKFFIFITTKLKPDDRDTWYYLGISRQQDIGDEKLEAFADLSKALANDYAHVWSLQDLILAHLKNGNPEKALEYYQKLESVYPDHPENSYYKGMLHLHKNETEEADKSFREYMEKNPYNRLSEILAKTKWNKN